ncbi:cell wall elongation regulator TseB-like domain-containing protein [Enterococcus rivorum]|uniref:Peptidase n=1 Tax=Enterococcus rivorum TaxID=762845 RepID=A0A1E5L092_9ENTE|nr:DUF5590 domain-containing protein [Enterococcus rivorum]MBP2099286.1 uncharacterized protein YpmB [Enterococcus rivorum]OEH83329.1 peptidase [Enterococcus rivorum]
MKENEELAEQKKIKLLLGLIATLLAIIVCMIIIFIRSNHSMAQAEKEATEIAKEYANLETVDDFYWFTRKETSFSVVGRDDKGNELIVLIPKSGDSVKVLNQKDGVSENQIRQVMVQDYQQSNIKKVNLGLYDGKATWEVVAENPDKSLNYYLLSFENAEEINVIKNI